MFSEITMLLSHHSPNLRQQVSQEAAIYTALLETS